MSGAFSSRVYVGRESELRELQAAHERASGGTAAALLIGGEAAAAAAPAGARPVGRKTLSIPCVAAP